MGISAYAMAVLADGTEKRIEDLTIGDVVRNPLSGKDGTIRKYWQGPAVGMFRITAGNGKMLDLTADQKVMTAQGMIPAGDVKIGTILQCADGQILCTEASALPGDFMVYDIALTQDDMISALSVNSFIVGDMYA